jgi:hypothetical protein
MATPPSKVLFDPEKFKALYQIFDHNTLSELHSLYSTNVTFKDPIHSIQGLDQLAHYFGNFCDPAMHCKFVFINQLINDQQAFFQWRMHYRHPRLRSGKTLILDGGTLIKFNSHIFYHEDFYDMGSMLYQHIPVIRWAIKKINARLVSAP